MSGGKADEQLRLSADLALPLDLVTEATAVVATRGAGKSSTSAVVVEEAFRLGVQCVVFDRTGVYWGLRSNAAGDGPGLPIYVLGGPHGDVPLEAHAGALIADLIVDSNHSFVIDLSDFSKSAAIRFAAELLERLYDRKARSRTTTLLILDEAHFYAPQTPRGGFKGYSASLMGAIEDIVGLGRSRGLGVVLTTQRTQALNKAVLDLIETLIVMRMLSPRARDAVQDWIREKHEDDREGVIATLDSLPTGTGWVWSPLRGVLQKIAVRRIATFDSYETPRPGQKRVEPSVRGELDLDALGDEMRRTAERAKENDPTELRRRLHEAETKLREGDRAIHDEPHWDTYFREQGWLNPDDPDFADRVRDLVAPVEVPALTAEQIEQLVAVRDTFVAAIQGFAQETNDALLRFAQDPAFVAFAEAIERIEAMPDAPVVARYKPATGSASALASHPAPNAPPAARPMPTRPEPTSGLSSSQQRILDSLAWFEAVRAPEPKRSILAPMAGVSAKSSGFEKNLSTLRTAGLVDYGPGTVRLTPEGRDRAVIIATPGTARDLQEAVIAKASRPQGEMLRVLIAAYPHPLTRDELAQRLGVSAASSGFEKNLSTLRTMGVIDYPIRGEVVALPILFLNG